MNYLHEVKIKIEDINPESLLKYITVSSEQKKLTLPILKEKYGISVDDIKALVTNKAEAVAFTLYHEESHKLHKDHENPERLKLSKQRNEGLLTKKQFDLHGININMEARANADAYTKLLAAKSEYKENKGDNQGGQIEFDFENECN